MNTNRPSNLEGQAREAMENTAERSKEAFETVTNVTNEATEAMQNSFSTSLKGIQDYNSKIAEFASANTQAHMEFVRRLGGVRSPVEFAQVCQNHSSEQLKALTEQAKELAEMAQKIAGAAGEPLKQAFDKGTGFSGFKGRSF